MSEKFVEEIEFFYSWSRDYWYRLGSDKEKGFSGLLNFGYWDKDIANLYKAQQHLYNVCIEKIRPFRNKAKGLEIGCGSGGNSMRLCKEEPVHMTALDISKVQIDWAKKRAVEAGYGSELRFVQGDSMDMPFEDEMFDFSLCIESSFHYEKLARFVAEQRRVLKPGAKAVIADITCEDPSGVKFRQGNYFYAVDTMKDLLQENDLEILSLQHIGSEVFDSLYKCMYEFSKSEKNKVSKYWNLVLSNYSALSGKGLMDYVIFEIKKVS